MLTALRICGALAIAIACAVAGETHVAFAQPAPVAQQFADCIGTTAPTLAIVRSCLSDAHIAPKRAISIFRCLQVKTLAATCVSSSEPPASPVATAGAETPTAVQTTIVNPTPISVATPVVDPTPIAVLTPPPVANGSSITPLGLTVAIVASLIAGFGVARLLGGGRTVTDVTGDRTPPSVRITGPQDGSIQPCGIAVTCSAAVSAGATVTWSVSGDATFTAVGPVMRYTFATTGAFRVSAVSDSASVAITIYAFDTGNGRTTLPALLDARPPAGIA